jgi:putative chitinase
MITKEVLKQIAPNSNDNIISDLEKYFDKHMSKYEVNTYLRVCHFIAQCAHESASFTTLEEFASGSAYEGRRDLGNTQRGDGVKYKGRGIIQLTGRANYRTFGKNLGYDLEGNPELAEKPEISVLTALEYWKSRGLNAFADKDDVTTITRRINGGLNGFEDRKKYLGRAKRVLKNVDFSIPKNITNLNIVVAKRGDNSNYIRDLQMMLIKKGYIKIAADGDFGPQTEAAVRDFQKAKALEVTGQMDTNTLNKLME